MSEYGALGDPSTQTSRRRWIIASIVTLVVIALVAGLGFWTKANDRWPFNPSSGSYRDLGTTAVGVDKGAPKNITAVVDEQVKPPFKHVQSLGDVTHVTPDGGLTSEITLRFRLNRKVANPADVLIAFSETGKPGSWEVKAPTEVSKDGQYAYIKTSHLSWWEPFQRSVEELVNATLAELKRQFDSLTGNAFAEAEKPECKDEKSARDKGYSIKWKGAEVLYYCLGLDGNKPVVNIATKRRYPIFVNHKGISVPEKPTSKFGLEILARQTFSEDRTVMMPLDQLKLNYELSKGQSKSFKTEYNGFAESLYQLEFGVTTLISILTRFGAGGGTISNGAIKMSQFDVAAEKMSTVLTIKDCFNAINTDKPDSGAILSGCFSPSAIMEMFGWQGLLLAPVMVAGPVINFFRNTFETLGDLLLGKDRETITVSFNPPVVPKALFVGDWAVHGTSLEIKKDGTGTYRSEIGACTQSLDDLRRCQQHAKLTFKINPDGKSMTGKFAEVWYTEGEKPAPPDFNAFVDRPEGMTFKVRRENEHQLITLDGTGPRPGNPFLCDEYSRSRNNTPEFQNCGA